MTKRQLAINVAYIAVFLNLATYIAHDTGRLGDGTLYWILLFATSLSLLAAVVWMYFERRSQS